MLYLLNRLTEWGQIQKEAYLDTAFLTLEEFQQSIYLCLIFYGVDTDRAHLCLSYFLITSSIGEASKMAFKYMTYNHASIDTLD